MGLDPSHLFFVVLNRITNPQYKQASSNFLHFSHVLGEEFYYHYGIMEIAEN